MNYWSRVQAGQANLSKRNIKYSVLIFSLLLSSCNRNQSASLFGLLDLQSSSLDQGEVLPLGAVLPVNDANCPSGWVDFNEANGRMILGSGSGNQDAGGALLSNRTFRSTGGRETTSGIPAYSGAGTSDEPLSSTWSISVQAPVFSEVGTPVSSLFGVRGDANLPPYVVTHFCKKQIQSGLIPINSSVFTHSSCSLQWSPDSNSAGRVFVGGGSGNTDQDGALLSARTLSSTGGHEYKTGFPGTGASASGVIRNYFGSKSVETYGIVDPSDLWIGGQKADSNMPPYTVLNACQPQSAQASIFSGAVVAFDLTACPSGWTSLSEASGRMIVSSGVGNLDANGDVLSTRTLGETGGWEYTTSFPISQSPESSSPRANYGLTVGSGYSIFVNHAPDTTLFGDKADSNMAPFITLQYCEKN